MDPSLLFMSVRDFQYEIAIMEICDYISDIKERGLTLIEWTCSDFVAGEMLLKIFDEKIRWEMSGKSIYVDSPVDILALEYETLERFASIARNEKDKNMFAIATKAACEILNLFL